MTAESPRARFKTDPNYDKIFLQAINQSKADLTALLHRDGKPDVKSFSDLRKPPYAMCAAAAPQPCSSTRNRMTASP